MNQDMKQYLKFVLKKDYREYLRQKEREGIVEKISTSAGEVEKKIIVLQRRNEEVGIFSDYIVFLRMIEDALEKNYIPIVDRKTFKNVFFQASENVNTWECFFEQPMGYTLEDIDYRNMEVYINHIGSVVSPVSILHCQEKQMINYWRSIARKYIRFRPEIQNLLFEKQRELLGDKRILGVSIREGYMKLNEKEPEKLKGHPVQASVDEMLEISEMHMKKWECPYVFFTCQTSDTERMFKEKFGDRAISLNRNRTSYEELPEGSELKNKKMKEDAYQHELEYITEMFLLSKCTSFICSENSGSEAAFIMSNGFENFRCIKKGIY